MKKLLSLIVLTTVLCGCTTTRQEVPGAPPKGKTVQDFVPAIKTAAMFGTIYSLREHPEWRGHFVNAAGQLAVLETAEKIDFSTIMAIVSQLPIKELKSDDAQLAILGATMLLSGYGDRLISLDKLEDVRPVARALKEGISGGLAFNPPPGS